MISVVATDILNSPSSLQCILINTNSYSLLILLFSVFCINRYIHLSIVKLGYCCQCFYVVIKYKICCYYHFNVPYSTLRFNLHPHLTRMPSIILQVNSMPIDSPSSSAWSPQIVSVSLWGTSNMGLT